MTLDTHVDLVSEYRALSVAVLAVLGLVFNIGTTVTTAGDAVLFLTVSVVVGYPLCTVFSLFSSRFWRDE
ncbi:hypothetical protein NP511_16950 [Natrinema thermotolerans]|uniref:Uncharacterized protein n=1 Tax=Natrinema thermotolerans TaxID=121872 RepID=A0AAF0PAS2_9EURY|nr:hypothetical protein [Natrinema thermotolerans]QCC60058.1 hypothetical protein DVR14_16045 [Natrinema thermotolerans]QCC60981.1 hypothetical protein DVR14_20165 [Natrinema thermotolerans]WMT07064.1 hypothetical protein NP511_16950 [Natrinema thermotolerans]